MLTGVNRKKTTGRVGNLTVMQYHLHPPGPLLQAEGLVGSHSLKQVPQPPVRGLVPVRGSFGAGPDRKNFNKMFSFKLIIRVWKTFYSEKLPDSLLLCGPFHWENSSAKTFTNFLQVCGLHWVVNQCDGLFETKHSAGVLDEGWISWDCHKSTENPASISNIFCVTRFSAVTAIKQNHGINWI